ncbi:brachyurin-like [Neocloeon triangulifer]|uniref:brachyurin-like n=1 Tax=Neocloeon triangulifer TaxID=2078957 RepID=UPI00286FAB7C|nr:brachyurin-like [Neocloeon triangulifer]
MLQKALVMALLVVQTALGAKDEGVIKSSQWTLVAEDNRPEVDKPIAKLSGVSREITGGDFASLGQFPWHALIDVDKTLLCGGSLISTQYVLTTAFCTGASYDITLGLITLNPNDPGSVRINSRFGCPHPKYSYTMNRIYDINLIKLPTRVTFTANISPVRLASDATKNLTGLKLNVSGFGQTWESGGYSNNLKFASVTVISKQACAGWYPGNLTNATICTKHPNRTSACNGDSGGALVYKGVQYGVYSLSNQEGCVYGPTYYTRVTTLLPWIKQTMATGCATTNTPMPSTGFYVSTSTGSQPPITTTTIRATTTIKTTIKPTPKKTTTRAPTTKRPKTTKKI